MHAHYPMCSGQKVASGPPKNCVGMIGETSFGMHTLSFDFDAAVKLWNDKGPNNPTASKT
jgi:hypothetical protein